MLLSAIKIAMMIPVPTNPGIALNVTKDIAMRMSARLRNLYIQSSLRASFLFLMVLHNVAVDFICFLQCVCDACKLLDDSFALKVVHPISPLLELR